MTRSDYSTSHFLPVTSTGYSLGFHNYLAPGILQCAPGFYSVPLARDSCHRRKNFATASVRVLTWSFS